MIYWSRDGGAFDLTEDLIDKEGREISIKDSVSSHHLRLNKTYIPLSE